MPPPPVAIVIEDQAELTRVLRDILAGEGFEVIPVRSATEARDAAREQRVDLVVSDLPSIGSRNDDPLARLKDEFPELGVIVVREEKDEPVPFFGPWRREGATVTLRRPFRLDDLIGAVRELTPES